MTVDCIDVKRVNHPSLKAIARIKIQEWGIIINDVKLLNKGDRYWVSFPSKQYEKDGKKQFWPYIQIPDKNLENKLQEDIKKAIFAMLENIKESRKEEFQQTQYSFDGF